MVLMTSPEPTKLVKEPGRSGSLWRIHYSVRLPTLSCDFFRVTGTQGPGSGESLTQFPIRAGDHVLADRCYARAPGIVHVASAGGTVAVRVNTRALEFVRFVIVFTTFPEADFSAEVLEWCWAR